MYSIVKSPKGFLFMEHDKLPVVHKTPKGSGALLEGVQIIDEKPTLRELIPTLEKIKPLLLICRLGDTFQGSLDLLDLTNYLSTDLTDTTWKVLLT